MKKMIRNADEAAEILKELWNTPKMRSIHFEFNAEAGRCPRIRYTIECFTYSEVKVEDAEKTL